ncbi:DDE-type integrase/transposase/recombinase [Cohnella herbarum]|uniref:DDE-type integrase/transposase/recombinase n=1 Tax=Cohnella herbarum TaxID=2728023 RepID=A0A7Z2ZMS0_9BACL|nr:DDE-type integrase/transposase/recombinase [Cohnella herbarum]
MNKEFTASKPNEKWVTEITYVSTDEGWLYLASVMDLYSREIVGWHMSEWMTKELVFQGLRQAHGRKQPGARLYCTTRIAEASTHLTITRSNSRFMR